MPRIPVYNQQRNITANIAEPMRNEVSQPFQDQQKVIGTLAGITQQWSNAHDVMQATEAKAKYETAIADIQVRAAADPDFKNSEKYIKELGDAKTNSLKGISNQQIGNQLGVEFDLGNNLAWTKIDTNFKAKELENNKYNLATSVESELKNKLGATEAEALQYDNNIKDLLSKNVTAGTVTQEEADKILRDAQKTNVKYQIYADTSTEEKDSEILKQLKDPNGKFSYLDSKTRLDMVEESQRRIFQNNQMFKRENELAKDGRFQNIFQKANEGTLTLSDLDEEMEAAQNKIPGAMDQKEILEIRKALQTRTKTDLKVIVDNDVKAADYSKFINNFIDDETDRQKGREAIVNAFKDGILSPKEAAFLNSLKRETEEIKWEREVKSNNLIPFKNAITSVGAWFRGKENSTEQEAALAIKKLLNGAADGGKIEELVPGILSGDRVNTKPDIKSFPEEGQLMLDPVTGVQALVFPDGHIEAVK